MLNWIVLLVLSVLFVFAKVSISKLNNTAKQETLWTKNEANTFLEKMISKYSLNQLTDGFGAYYRCDTINNKVGIKDIDQYSFVDLFVCFHEIGHFLDSRNGFMKKFYKIVFAFALNRLVVIPFILVYEIVYLFVEKAIVPLNVFKFVLVLFFIISILRIISIFLMEGRANLFAKQFILEKNIMGQNSVEEAIIDKLCRLSIVDQLLMVFIWISNISFLAYVLFRVSALRVG